MLSKDVPCGGIYRRHYQFARQSPRFISLIALALECFAGSWPGCLLSRSTGLSLEGVGNGGFVAIAPPVCWRPGVTLTSPGCQQSLWAIPAAGNSWDIGTLWAFAPLPLALPRNNYMSSILETPAEVGGGC